MHGKMRLKTRGGASGVGGSAAAGVAGGEGVEDMHGGAAEGEGVHAGTIKIEAYDGFYQCVVCSESVRGNAAVLKCSQCSANPLH